MGILKDKKEKLTDKGVKALDVGIWGCGDGLYLRVSSRTARQWFYRYKVGKKTIWLGLGGYPTVGLAEAREKAATEKKKVRNGGNPLAERQEAKKQALAAAERTFERVAEMFIADHAPKWRGPKQEPQWRASLKRYAFPVIGKVQVSEITAQKVLSVLRPIWNTKTETASRVRARIESVWDFAFAQGWCQGENPARWKGRLEYALPAPEKVQPTVHYPAVPWADLPAVMDVLEAGEGMAARCVRFLVLTAARSNEARGADWGEIDADWTAWTIPAARMKAGREHRVPLTPAAIAILKSTLPLGTVKPSSGLVFPGAAVDESGNPKPLSDVALAKALRVAKAGDFTVHGFRSTFRTWAAEQANHFPREVAEAALAHTNRDKVEAAYQRSDHFEQRRRLMETWANHATGAKPEASNVAELRRA